MVLYGTLLIPNKNGKSQLEYPIEKESVLIGRDKACDIRIVNKEVSRRHLEVYVNEDGNVCIRSLGREPVLLNGEQVLSSKVLQSKDTIEVLLEGRTREFHFQASRTENIVEKEDIRSPLAASSVINRVAQGNSHGVEVAAEEGKDAPEEEKEEQDHGNALEGMMGHVQAPLEEEDQGDAIMEAREDKHDEEYEMISHMVSDMVKKIIERVVAAAESHAVTPVVAKPKRKSVRFVSSTPEGQACDATMTIRCVPKGEQAVMVEDDTVAFSQWGFATMGRDEEEANVETVPSKQSKRESLGMQQTPGSVKNPLAKSSTPMQMSNKLDFDGHGVENTPGSQHAGAMAPASTPVTASKQVDAKNVTGVVDFATLAKKLGEIAEDHEVEFELPTGFMRFTPMSTTTSKRKSTGGPQSLQRVSKRLSVSSTSEDGDLKFDLPKDFMRFTPMSAPPKAVETTVSEEHSIEFDLPKGFMRFTPLTEPKRRKSIKPDGSADDMEYDLPKDFMRFTPMASTKKESSSTNGMAYDLPKDFMRFTPMTVASKKLKTPSSENIEYELPEDFMRFTPAAKSAVKALKNLEKSMSEIGDIHEAAEDGADEIATLRSVGHAVHELADAMDRVASARKSSHKTPGVRIAIVEKGSTFKTDNPQVRLLFDGEAQTVPEETPEEEEETLPEANNARVKKISRVPHGLRTVMVQANAYKSQALVLGKHLRQSTKRLAKMRSTARILSSKYKAEKAKRIELQNTLKELIKVREEQERELVSESEEEEETPTEEQCRVIVVGHTTPIASTNIEIAGDVVVVRPEAAAPGLVTPDTVKINTKAPISVRTACKTVRRISAGNDVQIVMDDIKMPKWIFDKEEEDHDLNKDMDGKNENDSPKNPQASLSEDEKDDTPEDVCHICKTGDDGDILLLCDSCDNACHLHCCKPIRKRVPKGDWFCRDCKEAKKAAGDASKPTLQRGKKRTAASNNSKASTKKTKENAPKKTMKAKQQPVSPTTEAPETRTRRTRSTRRA